MQLKNLGLDSIFNAKYLDGPSETSHSVSSMPNMEFMRGPYFSWVNEDVESQTRQDIETVVKRVVDEAEGCDLLFGFSQGAAIALLAASKANVPCLCVCPAGDLILRTMATRLQVNACFLMGISDDFKACGEQMLERISPMPLALYMAAGHEVIMQNHVNFFIHEACVFFHC